jgi:hypothetical protein
MSDRSNDAPEIVDPIELPERPFTARNLADYHQCPQKFLLSWFVPREETRQFLGGPATLHQAVRQALVDLHRLGGPTDVDLDRMAGVFEDAWDGSACADSLEEERLHRQGMKMLREYYEVAEKRNVETLELDIRMEVERGGHSFVAVADAIMRESDGGVNAIRWLSTRKPPSVDDIYDSTGWGLLFACVEKQFPGEDVSVTMYSLRRGSGHRVRFTEDELEALVRRATRVADRIRVATEFPCVTGMHCRWCRARSRCPALE